MVSLHDLVRLDTIAGPPQTIGEVTVTPHSQRLIVRWPNGGWVWHRPAAVEVERDGQVEHLPVLDMTRMAQWAMWAVVAIAWVWVGLHALAQRRRERKG